MKSFFRDIVKVILTVGALVGLLLILVLTELPGFWPPAHRGALKESGVAGGRLPAVPLSVADGGEEGAQGGTPLSRQFLVWVLGAPDATAAPATGGIADPTREAVSEERPAEVSGGGHAP